MNLIGFIIEVDFWTYAYSSNLISRTSFVSSKVQGWGLESCSVQQISIRLYALLAQINLLFSIAICEYKFHLPFLSVSPKKRFLSLWSLLEIQFILLASLIKLLDKKKTFEMNFCFSTASELNSTTNWLGFYLLVIALIKIEAFVGFWTNPSLTIFSKIGTIVNYIDINFIHANLWSCIIYWAKIVWASPTVASQSQSRRMFFYRTLFTRISINWKCFTIFTIHSLVI